MYAPSDRYWSLLVRANSALLKLQDISSSSGGNCEVKIHRQNGRQINRQNGRQRERDRQSDGQIDR